jgi:hypothetical protein
MKLYRGIDLHSNNSVIALLDEVDRIVTSGACRMSASASPALWSISALQDDQRLLPAV